MDEKSNHKSVNETAKVERTGALTDQERAARIAEEIKHCAALLRSAHEEIKKEVWGQDDVIRKTIVCSVAGGNLLAIGVPGVAKTRLVERFSRVMGLESNRIQLTPDLMPADILGSEVQDHDADGKARFTFMKGPVFTQFLMADEINRAGPRTQSALLQAMQEKKVTIAGETTPLKQPFTVMATQNPLEQEGTYPLPEAQLDRFLMKVDFGYPDYDAEKKMLEVTTGTSDDVLDMRRRDQAGEDLTADTNKDDEMKVQPILGPNDLIIMQKLTRTMPLGEDVKNAILQIVRNARPTEDNESDFIRENVSWGPGPRATQAFGLAAKANALFEGRDRPEIEDVLAVADSVLEHRMALTYAARSEGVTFKKVKEHLTRGL